MTKGTLRVVEGDVTNPQLSNENEIVIIPHCCNNGVNGNGVGVMGAGVAKSLRNKWPAVYEQYKKLEQRFNDGLTSQLGTNCYAKIDNHIAVVNMIAQNGIMSKSNPKPLKYQALIKCMNQIIEYIDMIKNQTSNPVVIHAPEFGGLRAGGCFEFVLELIKEIWVEAGIDVVIYKYVE